MWQRLKTFMESKFVPVNKDLTQCGICLQKYSSKKFVNLCSCQHKFCKQCIKNHVYTKIKNYEIITCPQQQCKAQIKESGEIFMEVLKEKHKIYQKIKRFHFVQKNPDYKLCPKEQCRGMINIKILRSSSCNVCLQKYCPKCLYKQHRGKCEKQSILHLENDLRFVQCMKCDFIIEKNQGCDHIKCRCGFQLCYKCGGLWKGSGHICIRLKIFQKIRSACLLIHDKVKKKYQTSMMKNVVRNIFQVLKKLVLFNIVMSILLTFVQIFVKILMPLVSIFLQGNDTDTTSQQVQKLSFEYIWPYLYMVISLSIALSATYLDGSLKLPTGRINFVPITLITLVAYFFLPNFFYLHYYEALFFIFLMENIYILIVILFAIFAIIKIIESKQSFQHIRNRKLIKKIK